MDVHSQMADASDDADSRPKFRLLDPQPAHVSIWAGGREMIRVEPDGRFYVEGRLVATDLEVYQGFRALLGLAPKEP